MILYHGTNQDIKDIDLTKGLSHKDFGMGFYLTPDKATAERMANKRAKLFGGEPTLIEYSFDETSLSSNTLKVLQFPEKATVEWARFIDRNRDRRKESLTIEYDIISGPIADDGVAYSLSRYQIRILWQFLGISKQLLDALHVFYIMIGRSPHRENQTQD